jgi:hypothetical protein
MANRKISDLTALTTPATGDLLPIVDISEAAAADKNKKITIGELFASIPAGTAAAPSIAFEGDPNTGIYSPGADQVGISTGGTARITVDGSGRLLVGTSTARGVASTTNSLTQVETSTYLAFSAVNNTNDTGGSAIALGKSRGTAAGGTTIVQSGDDIGTIFFAGANGTNLESQAASIKATVDGTPGASDMPGRLVFSTTADGAASPTERMRITSSGSVQSANWAIFPSFINNRTAVFTADSGYGGAGQGGLVIYNTSGGVVLGVGATSWASYSDERMKTDLQPITQGLDKVSTLRAVTGRYLTDEENVSRPFLIAQDVEQVLPEAVEAGNPDALSLRYTEVIPLLVAALKESKERIEALEQRLTDAGIS